MAVAQVLARLRNEPLADCPISTAIEQLCRGCDHLWRDRVLTPAVTLRLFLLQVLHGNTAIAHLRQLSGLAFAPGSYCEARQRLPLEVILGVLGSLVRWANEHVRRDERLIGQGTGGRVLVVDGSSFSTADTPGLRERFGLYPGARPGIGYPMGKLLGLLDLATGMFIQMLAMPVLVHDMSLVASVHSALLAGDILLGDRAFCSFAHFALLAQRGVFACCRLHQNRKGQGGSGTHRWHKDKVPPAWMGAAQWAAMPEWMDVRLVSYGVDTPGFRSRRVTVATTMLDEARWPDSFIIALYGHRWEIETCFNHLKTTLRMNVLKCRTVEGVRKELAMYLLAYNLVRLAMLRAARAQGATVRRVSFADAARWLCARMLGLEGVETLIVNPPRPGRWEPRVTRSRMKAYDLMVRPRSEMKAAAKTGGKA
jgi:hypothetical protein